MHYRKRLNLFLVLGATLLAFQNCGNDASFNRDQATQSADINNSSGTENSDETLDVNDRLATGNAERDLDVIADACDRLPIQRAVVNIQFPKPDLTCEWEANGNLAPLNNFFQARIEQPRTMGLPRGAVICDAQFTFSQQDFLYDDHFLLLFNDTVIASSYDFSYRLEKGNFGLLKYDWGRMAGMDWLKNKEQIFCPDIPGGQSMCSFPGHDQQGVIDLNYEPSFIQAIMSQGVPSNHSFTMVSIGDNDEEDCEHSDVEFDVSVNYVVVQ